MQIKLLFLSEVMEPKTQATLPPLPKILNISLAVGRSLSDEDIINFLDAPRWFPIKGKWSLQRAQLETRLLKRRSYIASSH